MPCSTPKFSHPHNNSSSSSNILLRLLKTITFLILFNSTLTEAYSPTSLLILSAIAHAAYRPIASIGGQGQGSSSSSSIQNRNFLDSFPDSEEKILRKNFIAEAGEIDGSNEEEVFDQREFVRIQQKHHESIHKYEKRIYSTVPKHFECYSCMSLGYQDSWEHLQYLYTAPKVFTNRCNEPSLYQKNIPTVVCGSVCVSLLEPNVEAGVFLGYKYIRGCIDRILKNGFNQSALRTHRFHQSDICRSLPRAQLFNAPRDVNMPIFGEVQLCSCFGDKCNGASASSSIKPSHSFVVLLFSCLSVIYCKFLHSRWIFLLDLR